MLMPKKNRVAIYEYLFKEGVLVAKKDFHAPKHPELEAIPNLQVIKALQSLRSRGYVKEQFAWRHYYWYLTNEGIQYLRDFLHLPPEIVPATLKKQSRQEAPSRRPKMAQDMQNKAPDDRSDYRRAPGLDKKGDVGPGTDTNFDFRGGFGRGRGPPQ
ncbi:40S ribosomal protein S10 [Ixodes scapularis]|uniref:40S ribosomal protein S10 n=2 Tax=Ixodes TaxID=6944 RepID=Q4PMD3_IXOSC|nr:40S ribosomal protein S10 [Ixodes scapularis]AAY66831.1 40S ribosomal protein S10 [Ixodes scapularis]EEC20437.1 40S ribosomal protein S10, putative [Ixodes scapularis]|eukprot:XP_002416520.1 40S ribosomal protein S10, putative [Ixodes scapularis]